MKSNKLVFFGTGEVSARALEALGSAFSIEAVITKPDVVLHNHIHQLPVKLWAGVQKVPVYQPANGAELADVPKKAKFTSQLGVVVDYGVLIPQSVITAFPKGIINTHYSLLPRYRGADPVRTAILNGDKKTGVTLMLINEGLDTGDILAQATTAISQEETVATLYQKLEALGNQLLLNTLPNYLDGKITPLPQTGKASYAGKLTKESGQIDWTKPAVQLEREVRAYLGWPGSQTSLDGKVVTITAAKVVAESGKPSEFKVDKERLVVYAGKGALEIVSIKPAGKAEMSGADFGRGYLLQS